MRVLTQRSQKVNARVRAFLENVAKRRIPITYQELAKALQILPPHSIQRVTEALERLMEEDAAADFPFIAALAISKARGGLPAPGFFDCARRLVRFAGDPDGQNARSFHAAELNAVFTRWSSRRQDADAEHFRRLLRHGSHRRASQDHAERYRNETPGPRRHSITSSARNRIEYGIVSPSALAVFRLTTSSNLVGCSIGRSAGLAPLRILST
jgi:hypothetical protein